MRNSSRLDGQEAFPIAELKVTATSADGNSKSFQAQIRIDTPQVDFF
ncbi:MAG: hypothetical protein ACR2RB_02890 [Gammaproteobacteria bacterium]